MTRTGNNSSSDDNKYAIFTLNISLSRGEVEGEISTVSPVILKAVRNIFSSSRNMQP